jgi:hypothetical protein
VKYNGTTYKYVSITASPNIVSSNFASSRFPVGRWLADDEDDKRISLELEPNKKPTAKPPAGSDRIAAFGFIFNK